VPGLDRVGLQLRSLEDLHRYFRPHIGQPRDVHVHVCASGSTWEQDNSLFRDYRRSSAYAAAQRDAVERWADDGLADTDAKSEVILWLLAAATRWSRTAVTRAADLR
jgi:GrpB-like predicted nucleotidyltransferase (UPF0157 family)